MSEKTLQILDEKKIYVSLAILVTAITSAITITYYVVTSANKIDSFIYIQQKNDERYENHEKRLTSIEDFIRNNIVLTSK